MRTLPPVHRSVPRLAYLALPALLLLSGASSAAPQVRRVSAGPHVPAMRMPAPRAPEAFFRANCATCHGVQGMGGLSWVVPSRFAPRIAGDPAPYIWGWARMGSVPAMPSFPAAEISDYELDQLAAYIEALPGSYVPEPASQVTVTVLDEDPWFSPMQISIQPGDTVRYVNVGRTYHPVVELTWLMTHGHDGTNSGQLGPNGVYYRQFEQPGSHTFLCGMHPYMRGEVHVGQPFTPPTYAPALPVALPRVPGVGEIWVCAQFQDWPGRTKDGVVQVIDAATWTVTHTIPVGNNPHNLWFGAGGTQLAITNWFDSTISRIDAATKTLIGGECIAGASPAHVTSDYAGTYWYVSLEGSQHVRRFTQVSGPFGLCGSGMMPPVATLSGYGPHGIWYANGKVVTTNSMDSTFSIIDTATLTETALLPAGMHPLGASANAAGTLGAAGNVLSQSVSIYDLNARVHIRDIPLNYGAVQVPFTLDGSRIYAANGSQVTVIDVAKAIDLAGYPDPAMAIVAHIPTGRGAHGVAFGPKAGGGSYAYVTHKFENYVSVIDMGTLTKSGDVPLVLSTTGKLSLAGVTDTGGNGIAVRPNPPPWQ